MGRPHVTHPVTHVDVVNGMLVLVVLMVLAVVPPAAVARPSRAETRKARSRWRRDELMVCPSTFTID